MAACDCHWCRGDKPHPASHNNWFPLSPVPVFKDGKITDQYTHYRACAVCGHDEQVKE